MVNPNTIRALNPTPGEAAAIAIFGHLYGTRPDLVKKVLEIHDEKFTGNPDMDFKQVAQLSKVRKRYFNEDFERALGDAKYFSFGDIINKIGDTVHDAGQTVQNLAEQAAPLVKPVLASGLQIFAPTLGALANSQLQGTDLEGAGASVTALSQALGNALKNTIPAPGSNSNVTAVIPPQLQNAIQSVTAAGQNGSLDSRIDSTKILELLKNMTEAPAKTEEKPAKTVEIFGKKIKVMYLWIGGGALALIIFFIVFMIIRARKKKNKEIKAAA